MGEYTNSMFADLRASGEVSGISLKMWMPGVSSARSRSQGTTGVRSVDAGRGGGRTVDHGFQVRVQETPLRHALDDLPELRALHAVFGEGEHHAGVDVALIVFDLLRPYCCCLVAADVGDDGGGAFSGGGETLAKGIV